MANWFGLWSFSVGRIISPTVRKKKGWTAKAKKVSGHSSLGQACLCCLSSTELRVQLKIRCKRVVKYCACDHLWMPVMTRVLSLSAPKNPVWKSPFLIFTLPWSKLSINLQNNSIFVCLFVYLFVCSIGHFEWKDERKEFLAWNLWFLCPLTLVLLFSSWQKKIIKWHLFLSKSGIGWKDYHLSEIW